MNTKTLFGHEVATSCIRTKDKFLLPCPTLRPDQNSPRRFR